LVNKRLIKPAMEKISRKKIRTTVNESLLGVVSNYQISEPSKKTKKLIDKVSKKISSELKSELKKQFRKMAKASKPQLNGKVSSQKILSA
jgi:hypothetical protein